MSAEADPVVADLNCLVFQVAGRLRAGFNAAAADLDLPPAQAQVLANLTTPTPMRELAAWLSCEPSNVTGIIDGLERRGLATRQPDPGDRRVKYVVLTEAGKSRQAELRSRAQVHAEAVFALPDADRSRLRDLLARAVTGTGDSAGR